MSWGYDNTEGLDLSKDRLLLSIVYPQVVYYARGSLFRLVTYFWNDKVEKIARMTFLTHTCTRTSQFVHTSPCLNSTVVCSFPCSLL